jgi:hypothetical protein
MYGKIKKDVREILKKLCEYKGIENIGRNGVRRPCSHVREDSAQIQCFSVHGIPEREKRVDDF